DAAAVGGDSVGFPDRVVEFEVGDRRVAGRLQAGGDLGSGQQRAAAAGVEQFAVGGDDRDVVPAAVGGAHFGFPQAVVEFDVTDLGVAGGAQLRFDVGGAVHRLGGDAAGGQDEDEGEGGVAQVHRGSP